uniref:ABC-type xenobiotic transporter n=1 Tax=Acrobeloides nanus TaxID=290746 RepID=A0A914DS66_9BILA
MAFCGQSVGMISSFIPDVVKARLAASLIFHLIEYPTKIDSLSESGVRTDLKGDIKVTNLHFAYPTRPNIRILNGLNLSVKPGKTIALVGHKRFYNPLKGQIAIDGINVRDLNIHSLRKQMAIVSQEPTLFDCTIEENISYGMNRPMSHEEVVEAAKMANIHDFILSLPDGYATNVGERGAQLSGGQKQRIAIARALIRRPSILLLDEATSALDSESERIVQDALEKARYGRTCLVIAHRLSTVQNADQICVINEGRIVQLGTHEELIQQEGIYKTLCSSQFLQEDSKED